MVVIQDGGAERALTLVGDEAALVDKVEKNWGGLCRVYGEAYGIPDGWLQAMIFRESGGNPNAFLREPNGWTGVGLLQITYPALKGAKKVKGDDGKERWVGGLTDQQLFAPAKNLEIGAKYVGQHMKTYGNDFPRVAAAYNAGSAKPPMNKAHENPWWLHSTGSHISKEVAALNYWIVKYRHRADESIQQPVLISLVDLAREEDDLARRDTEPPENAV